MHEDTFFTKKDPLTKCVVRDMGLAQKVNLGRHPLQDAMRYINPNNLKCKKR